MSRSASLRRPGRLENASARGPTTRSMPWRNLKYGFRRFSSLDPGSQPPAGDSATTLSARPRWASSRASQPPSELPTRCAFSIPAASMSRSTPSARASNDGATPSGNGSPPQWPSTVTAVVVWCSRSAGSSGSQMPAAPEKPWMRTSGSAAMLGPYSSPHGREGEQDRAGVAQGPQPRAVRGAAPGGNRGPVHGPLRRREVRRHLPLRRLRQRALQLGDEVRVRHGLAELHRADRPRERDPRDRHEPRHGPHRGQVRALRLAPRTRLRRRAGAGRRALLHELGRARARASLIAVPNVSEGRDRRTLEAIGDAFTRAGARVLDVHADPDHHRAVFTLEGAQGELSGALAAGVEEALARIDVRDHPGAHPHVGAVDVVPVVHRDASERGAAVAEALVTADALGALGLPFFFSGALGAGRTRAELRRGGPLELARRLDTGELAPDFGPPSPHPTGGATLVAARPPLIAFNLELEPPASEDDARRIAARVREGGPEGLPGVRAIGLTLPARAGVAQVSFNVENDTPLSALVKAVRRHAPVREAELVGLAPARAFAGFPEDVPVRNRRTY